MVSCTVNIVSGRIFLCKGLATSLLGTRHSQSTEALRARISERRRFGTYVSWAITSALSYTGPLVIALNTYVPNRRRSLILARSASVNWWSQVPSEEVCNPLYKKIRPETICIVQLTMAFPTP